MARKVQNTYAVRLAVVDGGKVKAELSGVGEEGDKSLRKIERGGQAASRGLESLTGRSMSLSRALKIVGGALSIGAFVMMTRNALSAADAVGKTADKIGIGTDALQELRYAAEMSGVAQERFDKALENFTRRIGEAAQGTGEAKRAMDVLGVSVMNAQGGIRDTETLFKEVSDAISGIETPAERVRVAFNLFGREGVAMINMMANGSDEIEKMRARARSLGLVLEENLIRDAERAGDELETLSKVMSVNMNRALLGLAPLIADTASLLSNVASSAGVAYEKMKLFLSGDFSLQGQSLRGVNHDIEKIERRIERLQNRITSARERTPVFDTALGRWAVENDIRFYQNQIDLWDKQRQKLMQQREKLQAEQAAAAGDDPAAANIEAQLRALEEQEKALERMKSTLDQQVFNFTHQGADRIEAEYQRMVEQIQMLKNEVNAEEIERLLSQALEVRNHKLAQLAGQEADAEKRRAEAAEKRLEAEAQRQTRIFEGNQKIVESLNAEIAALGKSERQNFIDQAVRRLSAEATAQQRREVERLAGALYDEKQALEEKRKEEERRKSLLEEIKRLTEDQASAQERYNEEIAELNKLLKDGVINQKEFEAASRRARDNMLQHSREWSAGLERALRNYANEATNMAAEVERVTTNMLRSLEDVLVNFTTTGKFEWRDMVNAMVADINRLIIRTQITGPLAGALGQAIGGLFGNANGNVFAGGMPVQAFAKGTVVFEPTVFPMAKGMGLMGEAGPEAIMPLRRLPNGRLGVEATGGGAYTVNVDARGSSDPAATARQVEQAVDRALSARIPGIIRTSAAAARTSVIDSWQRRGGRFD